MYAVWTMNTEGDPAAGSGFTRVPAASFGGDYCLVEYQLFTTNGTKTVTIGTPGVGDGKQGLLDAIVQGP